MTASNQLIGFGGCELLGHKAGNLVAWISLCGQKGEFLLASIHTALNGVSELITRKK